MTLSPDKLKQLRSSMRNNNLVTAIRDDLFVQFCVEDLTLLLDAIDELKSGLEELRITCTHDEEDKNYRPISDTRGWCSVCQSKVEYQSRGEAIDTLRKVFGE